LADIHKMVLDQRVFAVIPEYQRAVVFRFGRVQSEARGPGFIFRLPWINKVVRVNLRVEVVDIPSQSVITKDNVTIAVDAVVYFQVVDPIRAIIGVDNFRFASQRIAMTSLRSIIGRYELDSLLAQREDVNGELRSTIARSTAEWGVEVRQVEIRDVTLPPELLRAMARQAEAERERRAKIIAATGELQASEELSEAADKMAASPGAMQLRTLQTLAEVATGKSSTLIFPIPIELLTMFKPAETPKPTRPPKPAKHKKPQARSAEISPTSTPAPTREPDMSPTVGLGGSPPALGLAAPRDQPAQVEPPPQAKLE
jgi:regulator of protease activity HflC (stomatin/prohibitin superfamily)